MKTTRVTILNESGLHARPSAKIANLASRFGCDIRIATPQKTIDAKSIMQVMMLAATQGTEVEITTDGRDEDAALAAIAELFNNRFDE